MCVKNDIMIKNLLAPSYVTCSEYFLHAATEPLKRDMLLKICCPSRFQALKFRLFRRWKRKKSSSLFQALNYWNVLPIWQYECFGLLQPFSRYLQMSFRSINICSHRKEIDSVVYSISRVISCFPSSAFFHVNKRPHFGEAIISR